MSNSKVNEGGGNAKRSLPSWMSGKDDGSTSRGKKSNSSSSGSGSGGNDVMVEAEEPKQGKGNCEAPVSSSLHRDFSRLLVHILFLFSPSVSYERVTSTYFDNLQLH